jgi:hypothetical protein
LSLMENPVQPSGFHLAWRAGMKEDSFFNPR